ncbi:MAG: hypothetical protein HEQ38_16995 [Gemmatimonas sp.]|nr:hypothetical protein [Gemmatimonas sp.]
MIYEDLLKALRTVLVTVPGLPTERRWLNTTATTPANAPFVEDDFTNFDSQFAECGPTAMRRCEATYRVVVGVPANTDAHAALKIAGAIEDTFAAMQVTIAGHPVEVLSTRSGPAMKEPTWLKVPVSVSITADHQ